MDVKDVSGEGWLDSFLQQWEQSAARARQRKGQLVREHPPAREIMPQFIMKLRMAVYSQKSSPGNMSTSQLPPPYPPCVRPSGELEQIAISEMKLETHHRGKRTALHVLTPPDRMTAVMAIVEDEQGTAVLLQLYYQPDESVVPAEEIMQPGDVFILKEPFFKTATDGSYTLRVDHLNNNQLSDLPAAQRILLQMEKTYPVSALDAIRLELWDPYFALGAAFLSEGKPAECIRMIVRGMEALGFGITATVPAGSKKAALEVTRWGHMTDMVP